MLDIYLTDVQKNVQFNDYPGEHPVKFVLNFKKIFPSVMELLLPVLPENENLEEMTWESTTTDFELFKLLLSGWGVIEMRLNAIKQFKDKDFAGLNTIPNVELIDLEYASELAEYIVDYGAHLISLSKDTWNTSVCLYMEDEFWKAIIDLFTAEEGRSDLILDLHIFKKQNQFEFQINGIYVP